MGRRVLAGSKFAFVYTYITQCVLLTWIEMDGHD